MKRITALLLALLMVCMIPVCALAELPPEQQRDETGGGGGSSSVVTGSTMYVYTANGKTLHLRQKANSNAKILREIPWGAGVSVQKVSGSWAKVTYSGTTGYVVKKYLVNHRPSRSSKVTSARKTAGTSTAISSKNQPTRKLDSSPLDKLASPYDATVIPTGKEALMYKKASLTSTVMNRFPEGTHVVVLAENKDWAKVYDGGKDEEGYMLLEELISDLVEEETDEEVLE